MSASDVVIARSDRFANFMVNPLPAGPGVCPTCWNLKNPAYHVCHQCNALPSHLDVMVPITYSLALGQMHTELRGYKDGWGSAREATLLDRVTRDLAAVLERFLIGHEACIAARVGVPGFDLAVQVPSRSSARDEQRWRLRWIVSKGCASTADRYLRALHPTDANVAARAFSADIYRSSTPLAGKSVLLIDDTWTSGASAQSAAYALRDAGATTVACLAIGRHLLPDWRPTAGEPETVAKRLAAAPAWSWDVCALRPAA